MAKIKRSYYLPSKLVTAFDNECMKGGFVREKVVAAAVLDFLNSDPTSRAEMFDRLDKFISGKKE